MKEVLQVLDEAGGRVARGELKNLVGRRCDGELTDELLDYLERSGLVECPNGVVALTDAGAAKIEEPDPKLPSATRIDQDVLESPPDVPEPPAPAPPAAPGVETQSPPPPRRPTARNDAEAIEERAQALKDEGMSYMAIAEALSIPRSDVGKLLSAAARRRPRSRPASTPARVPQAPSRPDPPPASTPAAEPRGEPSQSALVERLRRRRDQLERDLAMLDEVLVELEAG